MDREGRVCVYRVKDIPNGFTFKDEIDKILLDLCKKYGGKKVRKTHYTIPMDVWEKERFDIIPEIEKEAKQTRVGNIVSPLFGHHGYVKSYLDRSPLPFFCLVEVLLV